MNIFSKIPTSLLHFFALILFTSTFLSCSDEINEESINQQISLTEAEAMLLLVNKARSDGGLNTLILNEALNKAAYTHSLDMETNNYFNHTSLNGSNYASRAVAAGYTGFPASENIAKGQRNTTAAFNSWMNSPGHKANILKTNITEMGLGLSGIYWTQIFGKEN